jgi:hypothetical protein
MWILEVHPPARHALPGPPGPPTPAAGQFAVLRAATSERLAGARRAVAGLASALDSAARAYEDVDR